MNLKLKQSPANKVYKSVNKINYQQVISDANMQLSNILSSTKLKQTNIENKEQVAQQSQPIYQAFTSPSRRSPNRSPIHQQLHQSKLPIKSLANSVAYSPFLLNSWQLKESIICNQQEQKQNGEIIENEKEHVQKQKGNNLNVMEKEENLIVKSQNIVNAVPQQDLRNNKNEWSAPQENSDVDEQQQIGSTVVKQQSQLQPKAENNQQMTEKQQQLSSPLQSSPLKLEQIQRTQQTLDNYQNKLQDMFRLQNEKCIRYQKQVQELQKQLKDLQEKHNIEIQEEREINEQTSIENSTLQLKLQQMEKIKLTQDQINIKLKEEQQQTAEFVCSQVKQVKNEVYTQFDSIKEELLKYKQLTEHFGTVQDFIDYQLCSQKSLKQNESNLVQLITEQEQQLQLSSQQIEIQTQQVDELKQQNQNIIQEKQKINEKNQILENQNTILNNQIFYLQSEIECFENKKEKIIQQIFVDQNIKQKQFQQEIEELKQKIQNKKDENEEKEKEMENKNYFQEIICKLEKEIEQLKNKNEELEETVEERNWIIEILYDKK